MRAICESCAKPQPPDWRAGDLCVHCGLTVRAESRCYWCAKWGPSGKFCRSCGAAAIPDEHYGAARMLKQLGASVFEIPKLLAEFEPERIETYQAIYQQQHAVALGYVDDVRWLEQHLYQRHWSAELEDELTAELPWSEERFKQLNRKPNSHMADQDRARSLAEDSPLIVIRNLAQLARLRLGDIGAYREATYLLGDDKTLNDEALLHLTNWRSLYLVEDRVNHYKIVDALRAHPMKAYAAPRLAWHAGDKIETPPTDDPDTEFIRAIAEKNSAVLEAALASADEYQRFVAACALIQAKQARNIGPVLRAAKPAEQLELLQAILRNKTAIPELNEDLLQIAETTGNARVCRSAAAALCLGPTFDALRLLQIAPDNTDIIQAFLNGKHDPEVFAAGAGFLARHGRFSMDDFGWNNAAKEGRLPDGFVESIFGEVSRDVQVELIKLAEKQYPERGDYRNNIARFVVRTAFATSDELIRDAAWWALIRNPLHNEFMKFTPFPLRVENVLWAWDSMAEFLTVLLYVLRETRDERNISDELGKLLYQTNAKFLHAAAKCPEQLKPLAHWLEFESGRTYASQFELDIKALLAGKLPPLDGEEES
jgi:hypothetical protein